MSYRMISDWPSEVPVDCAGLFVGKCGRESIF